MIPQSDRGRKYSQPALALLLLYLLPLFVVAAHKPQGQEGPAAQLSKAPSETRLLRNPYEGQREASAAGRKLYGQHCAQCHGSDGRGLEHAANLRSAAIQNAPAGFLFWALRNGRIRQGMPSWSRLPDQRLWQLVAFLKTLK